MSNEFDEQIEKLKVKKQGYEASKAKYLLQLRVTFVIAAAISLYTIVYGFPPDPTMQASPSEMAYLAIGTFIVGVLVLLMVVQISLMVKASFGIANTQIDIDIAKGNRVDPSFSPPEPL